jgi:hypothetical protein
VLLRIGSGRSGTSKISSGAHREQRTSGGLLIFTCKREFQRGLNFPTRLETVDSLEGPHCRVNQKDRNNMFNLTKRR